MIRGLYISASGMMARMVELDTISNNLANAGTAGFKQDLAVKSAARDMRIFRMSSSTTDPVFLGPLGTGLNPPQAFTDLSQGAIKPTGNPLDLAIQGAGFFAVETPNGVRYTRDGAFTRSADGYLTTREGYAVLGQEGAIQLPGGDVEVRENGEVYAGGLYVDTLVVVDFPEESLSKVGNNLFAPADGTTPETAEGRVLQGNLETSNVNIVKAMVDLISATRAYEASQKILIAQDSTLGMAVSEIAGIRG